MINLIETDNNLVTYSPAHTLVPTYECFNRCSYCNFRKNPGQDPWLSLTKAKEILSALNPQEITEILVLSGEVHPNSSRRQAWFQRIYQICELAKSMGFYPHTNAGWLTFEEMKELKTVNVSMGLMLEQVTPRLLETVHQYAPNKDPHLRKQQLEWAGELEIPFTTGILLGIGETLQECWETLEVIQEIHKNWGHIQEVILQPYRLGTQQIIDQTCFDCTNLPQIVAKARQILAPEITIQIPPNLIDSPEILLACLKVGARDLGGISPKDEVNPDYAHLLPITLENLLQQQGWKLVPRLPIYSQYYEWVTPRFKVSQARILPGFINP